MGTSEVNRNNHKPWYEDPGRVSSTAGQSIGRLGSGPRQFAIGRSCYDFADTG